MSEAKFGEQPCDCIQIDDGTHLYSMPDGCECGNYDDCRRAGEWVGEANSAAELTRLREIEKAAREYLTLLSGWHSYEVQVEARSALRTALAAKGGG